RLQAPEARQEGSPRATAFTLASSSLHKNSAGVYTHANMLRKILLFLLALICAMPGSAQCCPEKPQTVKREVLWQKLQDQIRAVNQQLDGVMGLAVKDLTSGEEFFINPDEIMPQASSIKIAVLANLYLQAQQGKLKLTDEYIVRKEDMVPGSDI